MNQNRARARLASGLATVGAIGSAVVLAQTAPQGNAPVPSAASVAPGQKVYMQYCAGCHGESGKGNGHGGESGPKPADLTAPQLAHGSTDQDIFNTIKNGIPPNYYMVPWDGQISDEDIWNVVRFLHTLRSKS